MSFAEAMRDQLTLERCLDDLGEALSAFEPYQPAVLAVALRVHLEALLQALLEADICVRADVRAFAREFEREVLQHGED